MRFSSLALLMAAVLGAPAAFAGSGAKTITVHGTGIVTSVPTQAEFTFGVTANGKSASSALATNAKAMNNLLRKLEDEGIANADVRTAVISLSANRSPRGDRILNYTATNSVAVRVRSIVKAGPVIDAAVRAGATDVQGPWLTTADSKRLSRTALKAGIADARARAVALASAAHVKLGRIVSVSEVGDNPPLPFSSSESSKASSTPVAPGTIQTEADVVVVFAIT
jgi:uncharacterized protein YggE